MNVLDTSIANVSIPSISGDLGVSSDQGTWVITSFAVANAISVPLTGWLTQRIGQVRLFLGSIILFVLASWLCGLAPTLPFLLAARVLQGRGRRPDDSAFANAPARELSARKGADGALDVVDDHADRAGRGPRARRLDLRQHLMAVDLLREHPGRHRGDDRHVRDLP
ncbi:Inner membrane component of tripartite multidrug resistance system [Candidatus Paraburkholderia schumanniana]|nr:Inner membrane component of tripartite multidrug resistance system [Candidatus Paraburkholderia schumannianae]